MITSLARPMLGDAAQHVDSSSSQLIGGRACRSNAGKVHTHMQMQISEPVP